MTSPHGEKLKSLLLNQKLPKQDLPRLELTFQAYEIWLHRLSQIQADSVEELVKQMVILLNSYRLQVDIELIFDSETDFLYRQKGQLKLDNSVLEEFLPILIQAIFPNEIQKYHLTMGAATCFAGLQFDATLTSPYVGGGMSVRNKDQDFAISRKIYLRASNSANFEQEVYAEANLAYLAAECKTNLDKTMFQEAATTALDLKRNIPSAKYYLLCEWLDMTPISSSISAIDEIIILRKYKRLSSNIRSAFSTVEGRRKNRALFVGYLTDHPFAYDTFLRFILHIGRLIKNDNLDEDDVFNRGYF